MKTIITTIFGEAGTWDLFDRATVAGHGYPSLLVVITGERL
jgi:hypothetical protein